MYIPKDLITDFFHAINQFGIHYVLIKNIGCELPEKLENKKDIDILVLEQDKEIFTRQMPGSGFRQQTHPLGSAHGWAFAYHLPEYQFWRKENAEYDLYIDVSFKLCCKSFMPKVWIPLDKKINEDIWKKRIWEEEHQWWIMDEQTEIVYLLVRSVFDKHAFSGRYISEIEQRKQLLREKEVVEKLRLVFFKFTEILVQMVEQQQYEQILEKYISFCDY